MNWSPILLTLQLAAVTTIVLFVIGLPLAYWLAHTRSRLRPIWEAIIAMPLILPPTVLGFYLLLLLSPNSGIGAWIERTIGVKLIFTFTGLVIGSVIYSLPFMVHPIQSGFSNLPRSLRESAQVLGKSQWQILRHVLLPNIKPAMITGLILSFAHTIGEFGVVLMIGGNIPGSTKVASIAIYDEVESLNYAGAHSYALILFLITFLILVSVFVYNRSYLKTNQL